MAKSKARQALEFAQAQAEHCESWTELSNAVFGIGGMAGQLFTTRAEREAFSSTPEYREIRQLIEKLHPNSDEDPLPSGRLLLRMPRSLHAALAAEAEREGISLNQLCLAKLCVELRAMV